jgi:prephenate dehydrogenase
MRNVEIGIIGCGRFGAYFANQLERVGHRVNRYDPAIPAIATTAARAAACSSALVIFAVPIRNLEAALIETRDLLAPPTVVIDVCSVKMIPCGLLARHLPHVAAIGTHPVFGPDSAPVSCAGQRLALCMLPRPDRPQAPADIAAATFVRGVLHPLGLSIIDCTPEEHDRQMARSQFITHFVGRGAARCGIERVSLSTRTHDAFMDIVDIVTQDTWTLFEDMAAFNPMARAARAEFLAAMHAIDAELAERETKVDVGKKTPVI